VRLDRIFMGLY
jgi:hypothetical protein